MNREAWTAVDSYLDRTLVEADPTLEGILTANNAAGLPAHDVAPSQGKLLMLLVRLSGARRVLEIGTLGGYSTVWLARGLPDHGHLVTLEVDPVRADVARANLARAELTPHIDLVVGPARDSLAGLVEAEAEPFDLVFLDADKPCNPQYLEWALRLSRPGTVIVADNVVRGGAVADDVSTDANVVGVRTFLTMLAADPRLDATALQTVGRKGWDGFALAVVGQPTSTGTP